MCPGRECGGTGSPGRPRCSKRAKGETPGELGEQPIFFAFHLPARRRPTIIVAQQMQEAVHDVAHQLGWPKGVESPALADGFVEADKQLAMNQRGGVASARLRNAAAWQAPGRRRGTSSHWGAR